MTDTHPPFDLHQGEIASIAKGAGTVFFGTIFGVGLKYIFELIVAKGLGAELFGLFFFGFSIFKILERLSSLGLNYGVLRYVALYRGEGDRSRIKGTILMSLRTVFAAGALLAILLTLFSSSLAAKFFPGTPLPTVLKIFALGIAFTGLTEILVFATQAFQIMKYKVLVRRIIEPGTSILAYLFLFILGWKILGATLAFLIALITGTLAAFLFAKKVVPYLTEKSTMAISEAARIFSFSWPLFFVGFIDLINTYINTLMLGYFKTAKDVGIYGPTWRTALLIPIILESFNSIFAPIISDLYNKKEMKKLEDLFKTVSKWIFSVSLPLTILVVFFAKEILMFWGPAYAMGAMSLIVMALAQLVNCTTGACGFVIMMSGRTKINLLNTLSAFILTVALSLILIPKHGILGAALSLGVVLAVISMAKLIEVFILIKIHPFRRDFLKPVLAGGLSLCLLFLVKRLIPASIQPLFHIFGGSALFITVYILMLQILGLEDEDKLILTKLKDKFIKKRANHKRSTVKP
ncbi:MAG: oligosaccharide flippase family protein [Candidatus Aminicenantes bacterium]